MKSIFDSSFKYRPSFKTDVRETFLRLRQEQQAESRHEQRAAQIRQQQAGARTSGTVSY
jgi:ribosome assembly protein YihI (activator of Der GTPase)